MKEKTIYICDICGGTYADKGLAEICEKSGYPEYHDKFVKKWIFLPVQTLIETNFENSVKVSSRIKWLPVRVESNSIVSKERFDLASKLKMTPISHSINFVTVTFQKHVFIKDFMKYVIELPENIYQKLNDKLFEKEKGVSSDEDKFASEVSEWVIRELNLPLPQIKEKEIYEYDSE